MDWNNPEARLAMLERVGVNEYNRLHAEKMKADTVETVTPFTKCNPALDNCSLSAQQSALSRQWKKREHLPALPSPASRFLATAEVANRTLHREERRNVRKSAYG